MVSRWRGRSAVLAIAILALAGSAAAVAGVDASRPELRVSLPDGRVVAVLPLGEDRTFSLRYRNSLYGTLAQEHFRAAGGSITLIGLEAEQLAVLEEYYGAVRLAAADTGLGWRAEPAHVPRVEALRVAATDRGERTLLVTGHAPLELWRSVDDRSPTVILEVTR